MRLIRFVFIFALAVFLVLIAMANRGNVDLNLFPARFDKYLGGQWSVTIPLFVVVFLGIAAGLVIGLIWEYLHVARLRAKLSRRNNQVASLKTEVDSLRKTHTAPHDEVLAILDAPTGATATSHTLAAMGANLPAMTR